MWLNGLLKEDVDTMSETVLCLEKQTLQICIQSTMGLNHTTPLYIYVFRYLCPAFLLNEEPKWFRTSFLIPLCLNSNNSVSRLG